MAKVCAFLDLAENLSEVFRILNREKLFDSTIKKFYN